MGKRGPLPLNVEEKWLRGGSGPRPAQKGKAPAVPRMPSGLSEAEHAVWRRLVPRIAKLRILEDVDQQALVDLCQCLARLEEAEADIAQRGLLVDGDRGKVKNPSCQLARQYRDAFFKWAQRFGLTPGDRGRIEMPKPEEEPDPFHQWLRAQPSPEEGDPRRFLRKEG